MTREQLEENRIGIAEALSDAQASQTTFWEDLSDLEAAVGCSGLDLEGISGGQRDLEELTVDDVIEAAMKVHESIKKFQEVR